MTRVLLCAAVAASGATAYAARSHGEPVALQVRARVAEFNGLAWSSARALGWPDFQGAAPADGSEGALTAYSLVYGLTCTGRNFDFAVSAAFLPSRSWVKPVVLANPDLNARTLRHEQTHFNLTEVYARRMRKYFAALVNPCSQSDDDLREQADRLVAAEAADQAHYDSDTGHGLDSSSQQWWDADVAQMLAD
jgi:hypothetical protein